MSVEKSSEADQVFLKDMLRYRQQMRNTAEKHAHAPDIVDDAVQDACLKAWLARGQLQHAHGMRHWLMAITANVCKDYERDEYGRRGEYKWLKEARIPVQEATRLASRTCMPDTHVFAREVVDALVSMETIQGSILRQVVAEKMDAEEIAATRKVPLNRVRAHMHNARHRLRQLVGE